MFGCAACEKPGAPSDTASGYPQPSTEAGAETLWDGLMSRTTLTRQGAGPVMTNDTIDRDERAVLPNVDVSGTK